MKILNIVENNFNKEFPIIDLAAIEICWDFLIVSRDIEMLYKSKENERDLGSLDGSLSWKQQISSMIRDLPFDYHPYAHLTYYLPAVVNKNDPISYRQDMACRVTIIRGRYYGFKNLRKIFEC